MRGYGYRIDYPDGTSVQVGEPFAASRPWWEYGPLILGALGLLGSTAGVLLALGVL